MAADPDLRVGESDAKKAAIEKPMPPYPPIARQLKVTGRVVVEAIVSPGGVVEQVRIVTGNPLLSKPAADTIKKWRFRPFQADGRNVPALVSLTFDFG